VKEPTSRKRRVRVIERPSLGLKEPSDAGKELAPSAHEFVPPNPTLPRLREAATGCKGCDLYQRATQTVFGEGPARAPMMLVGEQPGDSEDREGRPFVGPAGRLLDRALAEAGIDRDRVYVTNAVKHFKWRPAGKRRIHEKPGAREVRACWPWLESEIEVVNPSIIVALGATAAQALMGSGFRLMKQRGEVLETRWGPRLVATVHPSALLRLDDEEERDRAFSQLTKDLEKAARLM
jgi:DNA polymerase